MATAEELLLLHLTDIHLRPDRLRELRCELIDRNVHPDIILVSGDLLDVWHPLVTQLDFTPLNEQHLHDANALFAAISCILSLDNVYWVPGNHDPIEFLNIERYKKLVAGTDAHFSSINLVFGVNVHSTVVKIREGLYLAGFGGSVPAHHLYDNSKEIWPGVYSLLPLYVGLHSKQSIEGCPYTDTELSSNIHALVKKAHLEMHNSDRLILMTHMGPSQGATTRIAKRPWQKEIDCVDAGSSGMHEILSSADIQHDNRILMNLHGHAHYAKAMQHLGNVPIINPGPMSDGCYALIRLRRDTKDVRLSEDKQAGYPAYSAEKRWRICGIEITEI